MKINKQTFMKRSLLLGVVYTCLAATATAQIAIQAEIVYPVSGTPIREATILVRDGKIEKLGKSADISIPDGYNVLKAKAVTPGLIDARTVVGLSGALNVPADQDQLEKSSPIQPELRAIDAYNPDETLVQWLRQYGVTTLHTGHGIGALVSGQTMVVKTQPGTLEENVVIPLSMLAMTIGPSVSGNFSSPGTRARQMAMLRTELQKAKEYLLKKTDKDSTKRPATDLKMDALSKLLSGEIKGLITANASVDIMNALRLQKEFGFKLVLDGAAEAYRLIPQIKAAQAEIIVHPTMARNEGDKGNLTRESAVLLTQAGIPVSLESGFEAYVPKTRVVLFEAAQAVAYGLSFNDALRSITIHPAQLLGIADRVGSIDVGKDADLVLFDGDPFEYTTHVCTVIINGKIVSNQCY
jgi:imidazolonepropionase-like amidohydrolase